MHNQNHDGTAYSWRSLSWFATLALAVCSSEPKPAAVGFSQAEARMCPEPQFRAATLRCVAAGPEENLHDPSPPAETSDSKSESALLPARFVIGKPRAISLSQSELAGGLSAAGVLPSSIQSLRVGRRSETFALKSPGIHALLQRFLL